jgi:hypothetical protein
MVLNPRDILSLSQNPRVISLPRSLVMGTPMWERGDETQVLCCMGLITNSTKLKLRPIRPNAQRFDGDPGL